LKKAGIELKWGEDFTPEAERKICEIYNPVLITKWPSVIKPFYCMKEPDNPKLSRGFDLLFGGIEIRKKAGLPPWGLIEHIPGAYPVVLCVIDKKIATQSILSNPSHMKKIQKYGNLCTNKILENPSMENMFTLAKWFATQTGLISPNIQSALNSIKNHANASQCMLGNSIFAIGDTEKIVQKLSNFGEVFVSSVDEQGARLI